MRLRINIMSVAFFLYLAAIAVMCFINGDSIPDMADTWWGLPSDKVAHFLMFLPFTPLSYLAFRNKESSFGIKLLILSIMLIIGCGLAYLTEIIQERLSYRTYDLNDWVSDGIGLVTGFTIIAFGLIIKKIRKSR